MTLLTMAKELARNVGEPVPASIIGATDRSAIEILDFANEVGEELHRRADWGALVQTGTVTATGTAGALSLPSGFTRFTGGICMTAATGSTVRPLTRAEWATLTPSEGVPRYFLLENDTVRLWPYPALGANLSVTYIDSDWCDGGAAFSTDTDNTVFPDDLFTLGMIVRWRRQKGMDYADLEAEFEAMLADYASFDDRRRF